MIVAWTYSDPEGTAQSAWEAELLLASQVIEQKSGSGAASSTPFEARLDDGVSYQVRVRARDGSLLWSAWDQRSFTTSFPSPVMPGITTMFNPDTGMASISITNPTEAGRPAAVSNHVMRSTDGGQNWTQIATAPVNGIAFDPTMPLSTDVLYKAIAVTALPSFAESVTTSINSDNSSPDGGYWTAGAGFNEVVRLRRNQKNPPKIDLETSLDTRVLRYFAGRTRPVEMSGVATERRGKVEFVVMSEDQLWQVRRMAVMPAPHLFRLPDHTLIYASIGPVSDRRLADGWYQISFSITEVEQ